jgi:dTDP-4-dehydrorhamnose reductase
MLGSDVLHEFRQRNHQVEAPSSSEVDLTDPTSIAEIAPKQFDWVVNCAAYTAVDKAESEPDDAAMLNTLGPRYLALTCALAGFRLLHISTDFVFDGATDRPYREDDPTHPLQVYGLTKRDGEEAVLGAMPNALILRTSWLYGPKGRSFPRTMIEAYRAEKRLRVVADQVGSPTYTPELAQVIGELMELNRIGGIYHACGPDAMSWHAFASLTLQTLTGKPVEVEPIRTDEWPTPAIRPRYSVLSCAKLQALGVAPMQTTAAALTRFIESQTW